MKNKTKIIEYEEFLTDLGSWLKTKREGMGYTQEKLAELSELDDKHIQRIEHGKINMTLKTFHKLCNALDIDPAKIYK